MTTDPRPRKEAGANETDDLILLYLEGRADEAAVAQLNAALQSDPAVRRRFVALSLHARCLAELTTAETSSDNPAIERQRAVGIAQDPRPLSAAGAPIYREGYEPKPSRFRPHHYALAAALLVACGIAVYVYSSSLPHSPIPDPTSLAPVATLIQHTGKLTTPHGYPAEGDDYGRGEYALSSGTAEFMLANAVNVKLRGSARMDVRNDMNVALTRGAADFVVPDEATGFAVHLPDGSRVVDLGTAFSVDVDEAGRTVVRVVEGEVAWTNTHSTADSASVVAGQYAVIESGRLVSTGRAMSIASVDTIIDDANEEISRWRSPDFPKSFDTDGDQRYGSDGFALLGIKSSLPAYLEFVELGKDIRIPPPNDRYASVDRPAGDKRIKLRTLGQGDLAASPGDVVDVITYRITDASLAPHGFRIGVVTDGLSQPNHASAAIHLVDASNAKIAHASIDVDRYRNGKLDMVFFDVTQLKTGDALTIRVAKSPGSTATIQAVTWDALPTPAPETFDTPSGENRSGALAPNPTSDPVELQTTGPENSPREVRSERDEN